MHIATRMKQRAIKSCYTLSILFIVVNLGACTGAEDNGNATSTTNDADSNRYIGSIVDISGSDNAFDLVSLADTETENSLNLQAELGIFATTSIIRFCNSPDPATIDSGNGSVTHTHVDEDPPGQSTGDSFSTTYDNCNQVTRSLNGVSSFTIDEITGTPFLPGTAWSITTTASTDLTITFPGGEQVIDTRFTYSNGTIDGVQFTRSVIGTNIQSNTVVGNESSSSGIYTITIDTNNSTRENIKNFSISRSGGFGVRITETLSPLVGIGPTAESGVLRLTITNTAGETSVATYTGLGGGNVLEEIDSNNDGVIDSSQQTTWAAVPHY